MLCNNGWKSRPPPACPQMASAPHPDPAPAVGIVFSAGADGARSTSAAGSRIVAAAMQVLDPAAGEQTRAETRWRSRYPAHIRRLVQCGVARPEQVVASAQAALDAMTKMGMPPIVIEWLMSLNHVIKQGWAAGVSPMVRQITGREPRRFEDFVREHAAAWK